MKIINDFLDIGKKMKRKVENLKEDSNIGSGGDYGACAIVCIDFRIAIIGLFEYLIKLN